MSKRDGLLLLARIPVLVLAESDSDEDVEDVEDGVVFADHGQTGACNESVAVPPLPPLLRRSGSAAEGDVC
jgi:hypothetical protein